MALHCNPYRGLELKGAELETSYSGESWNGKRHGHGTYTFANSYFRYEGHYANGQKHGKR